MTKWEAIPRGQYAAMYSRHQFLWSAVREFIAANRVRSLVEAGCGMATLADEVEDYTGIDVNEEVMDENRIAHPDATWLTLDWHEVDLETIDSEMVLAASLIEHCAAFEPFLERVLQLPAMKYAVVTFHKGLRGSSRLRKRPWERNGSSGVWFDNHYRKGTVKRWMAANAGCDWHLYTIPHSHEWKRGKRWDSTLIIDRTGEADLSMWEELDGPV